MIFKVRDGLYLNTDGIAACAIHSDVEKWMAGPGLCGTVTLIGGKEIAIYDVKEAVLIRDVVDRQAEVDTGQWRCAGCKRFLNDRWFTVDTDRLCEACYRARADIRTRQMAEGGRLPERVMSAFKECNAKESHKDA